MHDLIPGVVTAGGLAVAANMIHNAIVIGGQKPVSAVVIAIVSGICLRLLIGAKKALVPGLGFCVKKILKLAIILMGFDLRLSAILSTGAGTFGIIVAAVLSGLASGVYLGRALGLGYELSLLIGTGTAICGASAIVAAAPVLGAEDSDVSYAVTTITLFGVVAVFAYPALGTLLGMSDSTFGTWAGTAVHDTAQVLAAGFARSEVAGRTAAIVKLTRTALLAPLILGLGAVCARSRSGRLDVHAALDCFPYFVLWFLGASVARTLLDGALGSEPIWRTCLSYVKEASRFLIVVAMAATGLMTDLKKMKSVGLRPFFAGLGSALVVGIVSLSLLYMR